jgi:hypothetical protein
MYSSIDKNETMPHCMSKWDDTITFKENNTRDKEQITND